MTISLTMPAFDHASVLVVGDVMLDRYWHGPTSRISPEAPVRGLFHSESNEYPPPLQDFYEFYKEYI